MTSHPAGNRATSPCLPVRLRRQPAIWRSDAMAACHGATLVSLLTFMPLYLHIVRGVSASETGLLLLPLTVGIGKQAFYSQIELSQTEAYRYTKEVMSLNAMADDAQEERAVVGGIGEEVGAGVAVGVVPVRGVAVGAVGRRAAVVAALVSRVAVGRIGLRRGNSRDGEQRESEHELVTHGSSPVATGLVRPD